MRGLSAVGISSLQAGEDVNHRCCNNRVGHLSVAEKVRYREQQYQQRGLYDVKC